MKILKILSYLAAASLSATVTLFMFGLFYQSHWSLDGVDITPSEHNSEFIQANFDQIQEIHKIDLNQLLSFFTNNSYSIFPLITWNTSPGGFSAAALIILIVIFALLTVSTINIGNRIVLRFSSPSSMTNTD